MKSLRSWYLRFSFKYSDRGIQNLTNLLVVGMAAVYLMDILMKVSNGITLSQYLAFSRTDVFSGEIWRIISFVILPPNTNIIFILFVLYIFWMMGSALEREWGTLKFNVFYLCGIIFSIIGGLLLGYATNIYINLSLLFAFAFLFPDFELRLFFFIPIKVKYLAIINAAYFAYILIISSWPVRVAIIASFLHIILFFWNQIGNGIRNIAIKASYWIRRKRKSNITRWK